MLRFTAQVCRRFLAALGRPANDYIPILLPSALPPTYSRLSPLRSLTPSRPSPFTACRRAFHDSSQTSRKAIIHPQASLDRQTLTNWPAPQLVFPSKSAPAASITFPSAGSPSKRKPNVTKTAAASKYNTFAKVEDRATSKQRTREFAKACLVVARLDGRQHTAFRRQAEWNAKRAVLDTKLKIHDLHDIVMNPKSIKERRGERKALERRKKIVVGRQKHFDAKAKMLKELRYEAQAKADALSFTSVLDPIVKRAGQLGVGDVVDSAHFGGPNWPEELEILAHLRSMQNRVGSRFARK